MSDSSVKNAVAAGRRKIVRHSVGFFNCVNQYMLLIIAGVLGIYLYLYPEVLNKMWWGLRAYSGAEGSKITFEAIFQALLFFLCAAYLLRHTKRFLEKRVLARLKMDIGVKHTILALLMYLAWILVGLLTLSIIGVNLKNLAIVFGALSVGIGFGLQNIVNNFVSGIIILFERPIKEGDWVVINGQEGIVRDIRIRATKLETFDRADILIPNADILSSQVINWTHDNQTGRVVVPVGVAYGSDLNKVRDILMEIAREEPRLLPDPEPYVWFLNFGDSSIDLELRGVTNSVMDRGSIKSDLILKIYDAFNREGIEIPFPQRVVTLKSDKA